MVTTIESTCTKTHDEHVTLEKTSFMHSPSKKVHSQRAARSKFSIPTEFIFHGNTEWQKRAFITEATGILINEWTTSLPFGKHCIDIYFNSSF